MNFVLLPFPTPTRYDLRQDDTRRRRACATSRLAKLFVETMEELRKEAAAQKLPTVLLTHVTVEGTTVKAHRISPRDDVVVPRGAFPEFELTVVGHIHKPEQHRRRALLLRRRAGPHGRRREASTSRACCSPTSGPKGVREITSLPLDPTPFAAIVARDEDELVASARRSERPDETLVKLTLHGAVRHVHGAAASTAARQLFPRLYGNVEHEWVDAPKVAAVGPGAEHARTSRRRCAATSKSSRCLTSEREALMALVGELRAARWRRRTRDPAAASA